MEKEELIKAFREIYDLWHINDCEEDIESILNEVIEKIGKGE